MADPEPEREASREETIRVALDEVYRAFFLKLVRRAARRYHLPKEDAKEIVHDAFLLALVKLTEVDHASAWLYRAVDNLAVNQRRKTRRRSELTALWVARANQSDSQGDEP